MKVAREGYEAEQRETHRHVFQVAVYTSVSRDVAEKNLAKIFDKRNKDNESRNLRADMAVIRESER